VIHIQTSTIKAFGDLRRAETPPVYKVLWNAHTTGESALSPKPDMNEEDAEWRATQEFPVLAITQDAWSKILASCDPERSDYGVGTQEDAYSKSAPVPLNLGVGSRDFRDSGAPAPQSKEPFVSPTTFPGIPASNLETVVSVRC
jgi:hypothetical protein